jgi:L-ascorbate metabolism protein UlaG (beta-lactamase superfamily)
MKRLIIFLCSVLLINIPAISQKHFEKDTIDTPDGKLTIHFIGHGTLMFEFQNKVIHVDPWSQFADYKKLPKADIILITHQHPDHLDNAAIKSIMKKNTKTIVNGAVFEILKKGMVMKNGDKSKVEGIVIEAVPAYNTTSDRLNFHPKGRDNGYVLTIGKKTIYIAGDTENIPEMANLKNIDIAFLPMNQPYTMTPEHVADAVAKFNPKILYPYHYGDTDLSTLKELLSKNKSTEIRIKQMK